MKVKDRLHKELRLIKYDVISGTEDASEWLVTKVQATRIGKRDEEKQKQKHYFANLHWNAEQRNAALISAPTRVLGGIWEKILCGIWLICSTSLNSFKATLEDDIAPWPLQRKSSSSRG